MKTLRNRWFMLLKKFETDRIFGRELDYAPGWKSPIRGSVL